MRVQASSSSSLAALKPQPVAAPPRSTAARAAQTQHKSPHNTFHDSGGPPRRVPVATASLLKCNAARQPGPRIATTRAERQRNTTPPEGTAGAGSRLSARPRPRLPGASSQMRLSLRMKSAGQPPTSAVPYSTQMASTNTTHRRVSLTLQRSRSPRRAPASCDDH